MQGLSVRLELPESATPDGAGQLSIAAVVYAPAEVDEYDVPVLVCWPGGAYGKDYYNLQLPGHEGYSFAEHLTSLGFVVIAVEPIGVGDGDRPADGTLCTYEALADAAHGAVQVIRDRLAAGGGLVVLQQARCASYDGIAVLGYTHGVKTRSVDKGDDAALRETAVELAKGFWGAQWEARYSDDITLFVLEGSYHCHNYQDTRTALWDRLGAWVTEGVGAGVLASSS